MGTFLIGVEMWENKRKIKMIMRLNKDLNISLKEKILL